LFSPSGQSEHHCASLEAPCAESACACRHAAQDAAHVAACVTSIPTNTFMVQDQRVRVMGPLLWLAGGERKPSRLRRWPRSRDPPALQRAARSDRTQQSERITASRASFHASPPSLQVLCGSTADRIIQGYTEASMGRWEYTGSDPTPTNIVPGSVVSSKRHAVTVPPIQHET